MTDAKKRWRAHRRADERGIAALVMVLGVILIMVVGSVVLANATIESQQINTTSLLTHYAYRALEAGITDFDYNLNSNFDYLSCNSTNTAGSSNPSPNPSPTSAQELAVCANAPPFQTWRWVPGTWETGNVPEYFMVGNPCYQGTTSQSIPCTTPAGTVAVQFYGASGYPGNMHYQYTTVHFQASNQFVLNLYWSQFSEVDPAAGGASDYSCAHFDWDWAAGETLSGTAPFLSFTAPTQPTTQTNEELIPSSGCTTGNANFFTTGNQINGPIFSDDAVFTDGTPVFTGKVVTADPNCFFVNPLSTTGSQWPATKGAPGNCANQIGANAGFPNVPAGSTVNSPYEPLPTTNVALLSTAKQDGCVYSGPVFITLHGTYYTVDQAALMPTPSAQYGTAGAATNANDPDILPSNPNQCMPIGANTQLPFPANGVIYVEDAPITGSNGCTGAKYSSPPVTGEQEVQNNLYAASGDNATEGCRGDIIVQGQLYGHLTLAANNNVIADGDLTYCLDPNTRLGVNTPTCVAPTHVAVALQNPSTPDNPDPRELEFPTSTTLGSTSVLGLIANQFVEVNDPNNTTLCDGLHGDPAMDAGALADAGCYLSDVDVEAAILALQHSFIVNNYGNSSKTINYSINQFGATAENFFELFGYFTGNGTLSSGYNAVSTWDNRFGFLGPPAYLKTGTQSNAPYWNITSTDVVQGISCTNSSTYALWPPITDQQMGTLACTDTAVYNQFPGVPQPIPSVAGDTYAQAQTALTAAGFQSTESYRTSGTVPLNVVIGTNPAAGTSLPPGSTISVIVSLG